MCSINFSLFFWASFPATTPRATTPHRSLFRLPRRGLPRPYRSFKLTGYHVCRVTTPELPRSKQTSGYRQVITPTGSFFFIFPFIGNTSVFHNNNNFSTEPGAHRTDPLNKVRTSQCRSIASMRASCCEWDETLLLYLDYSLYWYNSSTYSRRTGQQYLVQVREVGFRADLTYRTDSLKVRPDLP